MFFEKATKFDEIFTINLRYVVSVKLSTVKISSIFVAFLENMNFIYQNLGGDGPLVPPVTDGPAASHPRIIAVQTSATPSRDDGWLQNSKGTSNLYLYFCSLFHILEKMVSHQSPTLPPALTIIIRIKSQLYYQKSWRGYVATSYKLNTLKN